jgi:putative membrane protein
MLAMRAVRLAAVLLPLSLQAQAAKPGLDDAAIVGIFDAANTWDISTGSIAAKKASRPQVKALGEMLARDHEAVRKQGRELAAKLAVTPTPIAKDFPLLKNYEATLKKLNGLSGAEFDKAFLEYEVAYHKAVIDAVTNTFLPAIQNAELKAFVVKVAPAFEAHMLAAQQLLDKP